MKLIGIRTTFIVVAFLLANSCFILAEEIQHPMSYIIKDKNVLSLMAAYHKLGYEFYSIRDKRVALSFPGADDRSLTGHYMLNFVKNVNYNPVEKCWFDVDFYPRDNYVAIVSELSCYSANQKDFLPQSGMTQVDHSFEGVSTQDIFGYTPEFKEVISSSKKSSLFVNTKTKEIKKGAFWDKNFAASNINNSNVSSVVDLTGKYTVTFDQDFTKYEAKKQ
ncbi:MAG: hypothetical protein WCQ47_03565 [bacterium]